MTTAIAPMTEDTMLASFFRALRLARTTQRRMTRRLSPRATFVVPAFVIVSTDDGFHSTRQSAWTPESGEIVATLDGNGNLS